MPGGNVGKGNVPNGLYHFGERYDDSTTGRWAQPDPEGGPGSYMFDEDDPVNLSDPAGTCPFDRNLQPSIFSQGKYTYIQICGTRGRSTGKLVGYVRVYNSQYERAQKKGVSDIVRIEGGVVGTTAIVGGLGGATLCSVASEGIESVLCFKAAAGSVVAGGIVVLGAITGEEVE